MPVTDWDISQIVQISRSVLAKPSARLAQVCCIVRIFSCHMFNLTSRLFNSFLTRVFHLPGSYCTGLHIYQLTLFQFSQAHISRTAFPAPLSICKGLILLSGRLGIIVISLPDDSFSCSNCFYAYAYLPY
jgi:hypothetical protein